MHFVRTISKFTLIDHGRGVQVTLFPFLALNYIRISSFWILNKFHILELKRFSRGKKNHLLQKWTTAVLEKLIENPAYTVLNITICNSARYYPWNLFNCPFNFTESESAISFLRLYIDYYQCIESMLNTNHCPTRSIILSIYKFLPTNNKLSTYWLNGIEW